MADNTSAPATQEDGTWHTVEQAAVALGLSVRTVNRHIQSGKLRSRLSEGRREVFVAQPPSPDSAPSATTETVTDERPKSDNSEPSAQPVPPASEVNPQFPPPNPSANAPGPTATASSSTGHPTTAFTALSFDVESALARADNAADKAELAVNAYQNLARSIELQAHSARRGAKVAWSIVAVLAVAGGVAAWWTTKNVTEAEMKADELQRQAQTATKSAQENSAELERLRARLSNAEQKAAHAEGRAEVLEQAQSRKPATAPSLIERLTSAFDSPPPPNH